MLEQKILTAALAGLLHDIGKFAQRSGLHTGKHAEIGAEVLSDIVPERWRSGLYPVMSHHDDPLPDHLTKVVALADRLDAGQRESRESAEPKQMLPIFSRITAKQGEASLTCPSTVYLPLQELKLDQEHIFPGPPLAAQDVKDAYTRLWESFVKQVRVLRDAYQVEGEFTLYLESLMHLLRRYTWCVPSAYYRSLPDVSLYDHGRVTAALAVCLAGIPEERCDALLDALRSGDTTALASEPVAVLLAGDLSGIQDFIYTVTAKGAASALRGRSFYIQLLTEIVIRYVLDALDLPACNLIYGGGGGFTILARPGDLEKLPDVRRELSKWLLEIHNGALYFALAVENLSASDLHTPGRISARWDDVHAALQDVKQRRFAELGEGISQLFVPQERGGLESQQCQVCGLELETEFEEPSTESDSSTVRKCAGCQAYETLGDELRRARVLAYVRVGEIGDLERLSGWQALFKPLGWVPFLTEPDAPGMVYALTDDVSGQLRPRAGRGVGRTFLTNVMPVYTQEQALRDAANPRVCGSEDPLPREGDIRTFSSLAEAADGIKRLGVLRMDVDNMGKLFAEGFQDPETGDPFATLSRVAALSFAVSLFFEGWVTRIAARINARAHQAGAGDVLYSVYSGGDDMFFTGAWNWIVTLAQELRSDLARYTGMHPGVHASGGIVLVHGKYPLARAALEAGEAEHKSKSLPGKDAFSFLGQVERWSRFGYGSPPDEQTVSVQFQEFKAMIEDGAPRSLLGILLKVHRQYEQARKDAQQRGEYETAAGIYGPWIWQAYARLRRRAQRQPEVVSERIKLLADTLNADRFQSIRWIGLAARWADLALRDSK
ncbi:MAG: type III-A CRISPR-associated protein Cas10/Csm1 [Anaerolineae bacterium]|nr:type III-A CRISPR-associated protein Cas10/Csm1 [Anaerolineae bacterium]